MCDLIVSVRPEACWQSKGPFLGQFVSFFCAFSLRKTLQIDGPYDEAFYQKLFDLSTEDDGTVAFALAKVGRPVQSPARAPAGLSLPPLEGLGVVTVCERRVTVVSPTGWGCSGGSPWIPWVRDQGRRWASLLLRMGSAQLPLSSRPFLRLRCPPCPALPWPGAAAPVPLPPHLLVL